MKKDVVDGAWAIEDGPFSENAEAFSRCSKISDFRHFDETFSVKSFPLSTRGRVA